MLDKSIRYLVNFSIYHSRWDELKLEDFKFEYNPEKGAEMRIKVSKTNSMSDLDSIDMIKVKNISTEYLRKIIEYCQKNDIEILLTHIPYPATDGKIGVSKYVQEISNEYNVNYINFLDMDIVNYDTDCYDSSSHLNPSGARKVTNYIGQYIMNNYDIQDQRKNEAYKFWNQDYNEYIDYKIKKLQNNKKNLNNYLMLLYGEEDIKYEIKISSQKQIERESTLYYLLKNIHNNYKIDDSVFIENKDKTIQIITWDTRNGEILDIVWW